MESERRAFLAATGILGITGIASLGSAAWAADQAKKPEEKKGQPEEEVSAPEDLMREHGVLNRILLVYEEGLRRLRARDDVPPEVFQRPASLVRKFVEEYHERLEENFIFPEFERRGQLVELVKVLRQQHQAGRAVTEVVLRLTMPVEYRKPQNRQELRSAIEAFIRMYRPHEAREDTVLFPALHRILPAKQLDALGDKFEEEENRLFGKDGFEKTVDQVAAMEKQLGIYNLGQFTPKLPLK
jgi:hemerythrin-like domain-containing protein